MHREMDSSSATKMPQSLNSPTPMEISAADSTPVSGIEYTDGKKCGKLLSVLVVMLDDSAVTFEIQHKAYGQVLFDQVCKQLNLLEVDYFGLEYADASGCRFWLDHEKPMNRQLGLSLVAPELRFCVKFYTPCPAQLEEEYTRYLFCLQMKYDLAQGILQCNDNTSALMASYIVQADCGDYVAEDYPDHTYLSSYKFVPHQDVEMERRIMENHKRHVGQTPAEADLNLLETARRCELYGIKMHPAKDHEGVSLNLAIAHMGVLVFQNITKINTFSWAKIRKLSFKRKRFLLKLHPEGYGYYKDTVEFYFEGRDECKNFWKKCVEHHGFFRCAAVKKLPRQKTRIVSRGSSFRYSGRTHKQIVEYVRDNYVKRQPFQRSQSFRQPSAPHSGVSGGGGFTSSHSAQPLVQAETPTSRSCGSVSLSDDGNAQPTRFNETDVDGRLSRVDKSSSSLAVNGDVQNEQTTNVNELNEGNKKRNANEEEWQCTGLFYSNHDNNNYLINALRINNQDDDQDQDDEIIPESKPNDNDDSISYDSYLLDEQIARSPEKQIKQFAKDVVDGDDDDNEDDDNINDYERYGHGTVSCDNISYMLHRRQTDNELKPNLSQQEMESKSNKPTNFPRVIVEVEHPKSNQTSPTLYVRSKVAMAPDTQNKNQRTKIMNFVAVHDLPSSRSYSSQDDSAPDEHQLTWKKRKKDEQQEENEIKVEAGEENDPIELDSTTSTFDKEENEREENEQEDLEEEEDEEEEENVKSVKEDEMGEAFVLEEGNGDCIAFLFDDNCDGDDPRMDENAVDDDDSMDPLFPLRTLSRISEHSTSDSNPSDGKTSDEVGFALIPENKIYEHLTKETWRAEQEDEDEDEEEEDDVEFISEETADEGVGNLELVIAENVDEFIDDDANEVEEESEDYDSSKMVETTYYLEINSDQREELEKLQKEGGAEAAAVYLAKFDESDDTSSADNDTLCEEPEDELEDIEEVASDLEQQYEGINVRIHVSPEKSPTALREQQETEPKRRHRSELKLHVTKGEIRQNESAMAPREISRSLIEL